MATTTAIKDKIAIRIAPLINKKIYIRARRSTPEHSFVLRNIYEQYELYSNLYVSYVDYEKAFDRVHRRTTSWVIMEMYGIPNKLIEILVV